MGSYAVPQYTVSREKSTVDSSLLCFCLRLPRFQCAPYDRMDGIAQFRWQALDLLGQ